MASEARRSGVTVDCEDNLAELLALFHPGEGVCTLGERKHLIDDRLDAARAHELQHLGELTPIAHGRAEHRQLVPENALQVRLRACSRGGATGHQSAALDQARQTLAITVPTHTIDHHIDAAPIGKIAYLPCKVLRRVVDYRIVH